MPTYLEICQQVAYDSGTVPVLGDPTTVVGQTDERLYGIVQWVAKAWTEIQISRPDWRWMRGEFSGSLSSGTQRYSATDLSITRFGRWHTTKWENSELFSRYLTADGATTAQFLQFMPDWDRFYRNFMIGSHAATEGEPLYVTIDPSNQLVFWPTPDATYTVRGAYWKSPQTLEADDDTPEMPERFHGAINYRALLHLTTFDEAPGQYVQFRENMREIIESLIVDQTPDIELGGALA